MIKKHYTSLLSYTVAGLSLLPVFAFADAGPTSLTNLMFILNKYLTWFRNLVYLLAIAFLLYAAFMFITAAGNEEKVGTAKKAFIWGLVGIAVAVFSGVARTFITNIIVGA